MGEISCSEICGLATMNTVLPPSAGDHPFLPRSWCVPVAPSAPGMAGR
jgi:hypothetical protein